MLVIVITNRHKLLAHQLWNSLDLNPVIHLLTHFPQLHASRYPIPPNPTYQIQLPFSTTTATHQTQKRQVVWQPSHGSLPLPTLQIEGNDRERLRSGEVQTLIEVDTFLVIILAQNRLEPVELAPEIRLRVVNENTVEIRPRGDREYVVAERSRDERERVEGEGVKREFDESGSLGEGVGDEEGGGGGGEGEAEEAVRGGEERRGRRGGSDGGESEVTPRGERGVVEGEAAVALGVGEEEEGRKRGGGGVFRDEGRGENEGVEALAGGSEVEERLQREEREHQLQHLLRQPAPDFRIHGRNCRRRFGRGGGGVWVFSVALVFHRKHRNRGGFEDE